MFISWRLSLDFTLEWDYFILKLFILNLFKSIFLLHSANTFFHSFHEIYEKMESIFTWVWTFYLFIILMELG